ncbi:hypothetical protein GGR01_003296 [Acetobacter oeni]|nr:hypothetical protein [Acetobacter oeni]
MIINHHILYAVCELIPEKGIPIYIMAYMPIHIRLILPLNTDNHAIADGNMVPLGCLGILWIKPCYNMLFITKAMLALRRLVCVGIPQALGCRGIWGVIIRAGSGPSNAFGE